MRVVRASKVGTSMYVLVYNYNSHMFATSLNSCRVSMIYGLHIRFKKTLKQLLLFIVGEITFSGRFHKIHWHLNWLAKFLRLS